MHTRKLAILILSLFASVTASAQTEQWVPYTLTPEQTAVRVWTSGANSHARVNIVFPTSGYRVSAIGPVVRQGNNLSVDFQVERWTGGSLQVITHKEYFINLGPIGAEAATFTFTVKSSGTNVRSVSFIPKDVVEHFEETSLERNGVVFTVWTVGDVTFAGVALSFPDDGYRVASWGPLVRAGNDFTTNIRLERWTGHAQTQRFTSDRRIFTLGALPSQETFTVSAQFSDGVRHSSAPFTPAGQRININPIDEPAFFVRQHYLDFLGREPDIDGHTFWYNELTSSCIPFTPECVARKRESVSAAFFLSIEHQQIGYLVHRIYKAAFGRLPRFNEFTTDARRIGRDVIVGRTGWEALLEEQKREYVNELTTRAEFTSLYPETLTPEQYVDALNRNSAHIWSETEGGPLTQAEREQLANGLRTGTETRATVLRKVAENATLRQQEFNRAFVLMQYFGYLQRDPNAPPDNNWDGYNFWLGKLNSHRGDFRAAEMVKSFIISQEYRDRFRQ